MPDTEMTCLYYLDDDHRPVKFEDADMEKNPLAFARAWGKISEQRRVDHTQISDEVHVSTVFLGLDHSYGRGPPVLFETMIFGGPLDHSQWRYATWDDALVGHDMAVKKAMAHEKATAARQSTEVGRS